MGTGQYDYQILQTVQSILQTVQSILTTVNNIFGSLSTYLPYIFISILFVLFIYVGFHSFKRYKIC